MDSDEWVGHDELEVGRLMVIVPSGWVGLSLEFDVTWVGVMVVNKVASVNSRNPSWGKLPHPSNVLIKVSIDPACPNGPCKLQKKIKEKISTQNFFVGKW